jgi:ABC-type cobalt transport system substrate-binding protein
MKNLALVITLLAVIAFVANGCRSSATGANKQESSRLKPLVVLYTAATTALYHPPKSEVEFKKFMASQKGKMLDMLHVQNPDELFISERDGQPYVVLYGPAEKDGIDGKRMVGYATGIVNELDEEHFREAVPQ